ncbi:MAG: RpiB/LacA/LacB family sugar-phosphate isomerase [Nanoarchaeota archaeon]
MLKKFLEEENYKFEDLGPYEYDSEDDYVDYAIKVCERVLKEGGLGILICGTGQGMDRIANKIPGIYAEVCWDIKTALHAKEHSDANVLCLGEQTIEPRLAGKMIKIWLESSVKKEEKYIRRINKTKEIERKYMK